RELCTDKLRKLKKAEFQQPARLPSASDSRKVCHRRAGALRTYSPLNLTHAAIDEQFNACDVTAVVRCQKYDCFGNFVRSADAPERD
ncbi:MAG: hypothetical protein JWN34_5700, partial [Bryobacterales bacterium]|nr:hypothetical protein [Bryobacterales bacterium]